ncbi:exodeoxyribonuclease-3 [Flexibacter flexilis DSM 6793]|uniref:Exodeoxyribonuclease-3 n=1 Tax=Flexibacter flexilis DSM 6793 TaxID=927664 RepID=A0A1I1JUY7_9BACT|nr:exodeoxyribonuclease III [Flexibacter flexilis]SFC52336.1 exodeoxyribonuclease-3 [Flexibacter flexilis DSM 6793]
MKLVTYNVNGIRAAITKGFWDWLAAVSPDIICLQEIKATPEQFDTNVLAEMGYEAYFFPAEKKGYSGVAIFTKIPAKNVEYGCGMARYDAEGRVLRVDFEDFSVMSVYMPSGSSGEERQQFKFEWLNDFLPYAQQLAQQYPNLIISGDYNICHKAIDIHNPKSNANSSGFLPEERAWFDAFLEKGFVDTFRVFNQEPHHYTWWSYRAGARAKNLGWRIDYNIATVAMTDRLKRSVILPEAKHSDHCPVLLEFE